MVIVEYKGEQYKIGEVLITARPYHAGRFYIHSLDDDELDGTVVWAWQVKFIRCTEHIRGDFCREHDLDILHAHQAGVI